jgi:hypothetical protein
MRGQLQHSVSGERRWEAMRLGAIIAAIACLVGAGLLLWSRNGDAVFSDLVLNAVAWCF